MAFCHFAAPVLCQVLQMIGLLGIDGHKRYCKTINFPFKNTAFYIFGLNDRIFGHKFYDFGHKPNCKTIILPSKGASFYVFGLDDRIFGHKV